MAYLDKTFCASPNCENECGRKMTELEKKQLEAYEHWTEYGGIAMARFCEEKPASP
jgi:hypothetical protein